MDTTRILIVFLVLLLVGFMIADRQGRMRILNEHELKMKQVEVELKKEENRRLELMKNALSK